MLKTAIFNKVVCKSYNRSDIFNFYSDWTYFVIIEKYIRKYFFIFKDWNIFAKIFFKLTKNKTRKKLFLVYFFNENKIGLI